MKNAKDIVPERLLETVGMLPLLHARTGGITVSVAGPMAEALAREALKWRDVQTLYTFQQLGIKDRRIQIVRTLMPHSVDVVLLSPEQRPGPWWAALSRDGIISACTSEQSMWPKLLDDFRCQLGSVVPWRNYLPRPLYGALGRNAATKAVRTRQPPKAAAHLTVQYLPSLFTFAKDELPMAFTRSCVRVANQPGSAYELARKGATAERGMQLPQGF